MSAKTVTLGLEAYASLRNSRRPGETFSDTVKRLTGRKRSLPDFAGIWKDMPKEDFAKIQSFLAEGRRRDMAKMVRIVGEARSSRTTEKSRRSRVS